MHACSLLLGFLASSASAERAGSPMRGTTAFNMYRMAKERDARRLKSSVGPMAVDLPANSAAVRASAFAVERHTTSLGSGICALSFDGGVGKTVLAGVLTFTVNSTNAAVNHLEDAFGQPGAELNNIDISTPFRGSGGGNLLIGAMLAEISSRRVAFVLLSKLDLGGGRLTRWYESMGFHNVEDVLPGDILSHEAIDTSPMHGHMLGLTDELFP